MKQKKFYPGNVLVEKTSKGEYMFVVTKETIFENENISLVKEKLEDGETVLDLINKLRP